MLVFSEKIRARVAKEKGFFLIFLESFCDDPDIISANVDLKVNAGDPDYKDMSRDEARRDFLRRIAEYEAVYQTVTEPNLSYLRIKNVGSQVTVCQIHGYLQSRVAYYLMNLHIKPRSIFFSRVRASAHIATFVSAYHCFSMVKASSTLKERLVVTRHCPREASNTRICSLR